MATSNCFIICDARATICCLSVLFTCHKKPVKTAVMSSETLEGLKNNPDDVIAMSLGLC